TSSASIWSSSCVKVIRNPSRTATRVPSTVSSMTLVFQSVSRNRSVRERVLSSSKRIAAPSHGLNDRAVEALVELAPQSIDVHFDDVCGAFPIHFPQVLAEHSPRHHLTGEAHE